MYKVEREGKEVMGVFPHRLNQLDKIEWFTSLVILHRLATKAPLKSPDPLAHFPADM